MYGYDREATYIDLVLRHAGASSPANGCATNMSSQGAVKPNSCGRRYLHDSNTLTTVKMKRVRKLLTDPSGRFGESAMDS